MTKVILINILIRQRCGLCFLLMDLYCFEHFPMYYIYYPAKVKFHSKLAECRRTEQTDTPQAASARLRPPLSTDFCSFSMNRTEIYRGMSEYLIFLSFIIPPLK